MAIRTVTSVTLADTSVWIDHLRSENSVMRQLLSSQLLRIHPFVIGELGVGNLNPRASILRFLVRLPQLSVAKHMEVMHFIDRHELYGVGIGLIDAHLLAAVALTPGTRLWTRDKRLLVAAERLNLNFSARE